MKLPVGETITETFAFIWRERKYFFLLTLPPVVLLSIAITVLFGTANIYLPGLVQETTDFSAFEAASAISVASAVAIFIVMFVVYILFSVAWHRRYLLTAEPATIGSAYRWRLRHGSFLWATIKIILIMFIVGIVIGILAVVLIVPIFMAGSPEIARYSGFIVNIIAMVFFYMAIARLSMWLPSAAVDRPLKLAEVMSLTRGNGFRLFVVYIAATIIATVIIGGISLGVGKLYAAAGLDVSLTAVLIRSLVDQFLTFVSIAVGVSVLSVSYKFLTAAQPAQPAAPDPE